MKPKRNLNLYSTSNESRFKTETTTKPGLSVTKTKKTSNFKYVLKLNLEEAERIYRERMSKFELCKYLDQTIKTIVNCTWVQLSDRYLVSLNEDTTTFIDWRVKTLAEMATKIKQHHNECMIICDGNELIIYKNQKPKQQQKLLPKPITKLLTD